jgi:hypothetical protein
MTKEHFSVTRAAIIVVGLLVNACSSGGDSPGNTGGATGTGGAGGSVTATGGSAGTNGATGGTDGTGGATEGTGGSAGSAGSAGDADGSVGDGGAAGAGGGDAGGPDAGGAGGGVSVSGWYEAEAPTNQLINGASITTCGAGTCAAGTPITEGLECCSAGKKVGQILGRRGGALQFNGISAPSDVMYDVTWWFHCGKSDNFGDTDCGGQPHTPAGCRPHQIVVNGTELPGTYHFPCFAGSWGQIHASTTSLPLKSGDNTIKVYAKAPRDAADMDAIAVAPSGQGTPPLITAANR